MLRSLTPILTVSLLAACSGNEGSDSTDSADDSGVRMAGNLTVHTGGEDISPQYGVVTSQGAGLSILSSTEPTDCQLTPQRGLIVRLTVPAAEPGEYPDAGIQITRVAPGDSSGMSDNCTVVVASVTDDRVVGNVAYSPEYSATTVTGTFDVARCP